MRHQRFIIAVLVLFSLAAFSRAPFGQFLNYDDDDYVTSNAYVRQGLTARGVVWAFTTSHGANYHPLTWLSLMLDSQLLGTGPRGYHLVNVLLHTLAAVLLYLALQALTQSPWRSALVALFWAVHPLRVESVAWISERKDVLSGCLAYGTLLAYAGYAHRPGVRRYLLVVVLFVLGLLAKPMLVTLPFLLLLLDIWPLRRIASMKALPPPSDEALSCPSRSLVAVVREKAPLLLVSVIFSVITYRSQRAGGAVPGLDLLPVTYRLSNAFVAYVRYLGKMVWFHGLIADYPYQTWSLGQIVVCIGLLLVVTLAVGKRFRRNPWLTIGWLWYLGMLVPVIGLIQAGNQSLADRYTYLPAVGLLVMVVWSLPERLFQAGARREVLVGVTLVVAAVLSAFTWRQTGYWMDSENLFSHVLDFAPDSAAAMAAMGYALDHEQGQLPSPKALAYLQRAIKADPSLAFAQFEMGDALMRRDRPGEALPFLLRSVELDPNRAMTQDALGRGLRQLNRYEEAVVHLHRAVEIDPGSAQAHNNLGTAYMGLNKFDLGVHEFRLALEIEPDFIQARMNLAAYLMTQNRFDEATAEYQRVLSLDSGNIDAYYNAAMGLMNQGRFKESLGYLQEVVRRKPQIAQGHAALAQVLIALGRSDEAVPQLRQALDLEPSNRDFRDILGRVLASRRPTTWPAATRP